MTTVARLTRNEMATDEIAGRPVVLHYGDPLGEYASLRTGALLVDRSHRGRLRLSGEKAAEMLTGLVTNDVGALQPGQGLYAAALTPKGKIVSDIRVFAEEGSLLTDAPARAAEAWIAMVRKYVNPRIAPLQDESATLRSIGIFGARARQLLGEVTGIGASALSALPPYAHVPAELDGAPLRVAHVPDLGVDGFDLWMPAGAFDAAWRRLTSAGATPGGIAAFDIARVEAGRPEWGVDIDDATLPQEANLDDLHAISYTKGCYVGQETVARVHFRGHVNRHLRGLHFEGDEIPPSRAQLVDDSGKSVGDVRSSVRSPRLGPIGIGMVRREVSIGTPVSVKWDGGTTRAAVLGLPFPL